MLSYALLALGAHLMLIRAVKRSLVCVMFDREAKADQVADPVVLILL